MLIKIDNFGGIIPKIDPKNLPNSNAQIANNLTVYSGKIESETTSDIPSAETTETIDTPTEYTIFSAPSASCTTSGRLFDVDTLSCSFWVYRFQNGSLEYTWTNIMTRTSYSYTDTGVKVTFKFPAYPASLIFTVTPEDDPQIDEFRGGQYRLTIGGVGSIPASEPSTYGSPMFGTNSLVLTSGGHTYGEIRILSVENGDVRQKQVTNPSTRGNNVYYEFVFGQREVTFNIDLGYNKYLPVYTYYIQSYVDGNGLEGPPSDPSNQVQRIPGSPVVVTGTNGARLYRSATGIRTQDFYYLDDMTSTTYTDWKTDDDLGESLSEYYGNRPDGITGIRRFPVDVLVGYVGTTVYFSAPGKPHVFPEEYSYELNIYPQDGSTAEIIGMEVIGNNVYVITNAEPFVLSGYHPENMSAQKLAFYYPCMSASSILRINDVIYYVSENGIVMQRGLRADVITYPFFTAEGWNYLSPAAMTLTYAGDRLYVSGISSAGHSREPLGVTATALMFELENYLPKNLITMNGSSKMTWRSKEFQIDRPVPWKCARVVASTYSDITLNLYAKDSFTDTEAIKVYTRKLTDDTAFHLTSEYPSKIWEIEIIASTSTIIDALYLSTSMREIKNGSS